MDTPTQALLGAVIGQAGFEKHLGRRAVWWGAAAGLLPDADVILVLPYGRMGEFLYHRGVTHSLWFGPVAGPMLALFLWRWYRQRRGEEGAGPLWAWIGLFVLALFTHPLLDAFTIYGTQLLAPFSDHRFALNGIAIIDPAYSALLVLALVAGSRWKSRPRLGMIGAYVALCMTTAYLAYGLHLNNKAESEARRQLLALGHMDVEVRAYPTLLQPYLRRVVARTPSEVHVGLLSMWHIAPIEWKSFAPEADPRIDRFLSTREGEVFTWFAMNQISTRVIEGEYGTTIEIEDLRYGFPGPPDEGLWGVRGRYDDQGNLEGEVEYFQRSLPASIPALVVQLMKGAFFPLSVSSP